MTARIAIARHAAQRIAERLEPLVGADATGHVVDAVLEAEFECRYTRHAPQWLPRRSFAKRSSRRFVEGRIGAVRFLAVVERGRRTPMIVTVLTQGMHRALAPLPELPDGRVIGRPRTTPLPVAFQPVAA